MHILNRSAVASGIEPNPSRVAKPRYSPLGSVAAQKKQRTVTGAPNHSHSESSSRAAYFCVRTPMAGISFTAYPSGTMNSVDAGSLRLMLARR